LLLMKFTNPWIDPRVQDVTPQQLLEYVTQRGWHLDSAPERVLRIYAIYDSANTVAALLAVPTTAAIADYLECVINAIASLAQYEERYAGAVLDEVLHIGVRNGAAASTALVGVG
jgi:hypothetical protein